MERFTGNMRTEIYSEEHQRLRKILRRERLAAGLRQTDLAEKTGRSQAYISKFEKGDLRLDVVDFVRFCGVIGCSVLNVLTEVFGEERVEKFTIGPAKDVKHTVLLSPSDVERHEQLAKEKPTPKLLPSKKKPTDSQKNNLRKH